MTNEVHPVKTKLWTVLVLSLALILVTSTFTAIVPGFMFKVALGAPTDPVITTSVDGPNNRFFYDEILQVQVYDPTFDNNGISADTRQVEIVSDFGSAPNEIFNLWEIGDSGQFEFFLVHKDSVTIPTIEADLDTNNPLGAVLSGSGGVDIDGDGFEDRKSPIIRFGTGSDLDLSGFEKFTSGFLFSIRAESTSGPFVVVSRAIQFDNTVGSVSVDRTDYGTDNLLYLTIDDQDGNLNPTDNDSFTISPTDLFNLFDVLGATFPDYITFSETGDNSAQFEAIFQLSPSDNATISNELVFNSSSVALTLRDVVSYLPGIHSTAYDPYGLLNTASFTVGDQDGVIGDPGTVRLGTELTFTVTDNDQNKDSFNEDSLPPSAVKVMIDNGDTDGSGAIDAAGEGDEEDIPMIETGDNTGIFIPDLPNDELKITFLDDSTTPTPQNGILEFTPFYVPNPVTIAYTDPLDASSSPQTFNLPLTLTIQTGTVNLPSIVTPIDTFTLELIDSDLNDDPRAVDSYTLDLGGTGPFPLKKGGVSIDSTAAIGIDIEGNPLTFATPLHYTLIETGPNTGVFVEPSVSMPNILTSSAILVPADGDNFTVRYYDKFVPTVTTDTATFVSTLPAVLITDVNCRQGPDFVNDPLCSSPTTPVWGRDQFLITMVAMPIAPGDYTVLLQGHDPDGNVNYAQWITSTFAGTPLEVGLSVPPYVSDDIGANTLTAKLIPGTNPGGASVASSAPLTINVQKHPTSILLNQPSNVVAGTSLTLSGFIADAVTGESLDGAPISFDGDGALHIQDTTSGNVAFDDPDGVEVSVCATCVSESETGAGNTVLLIDARGTIDVPPTSGIVTLVIDGMGDKVYSLEVTEVGGTTFTEGGAGDPSAPQILHLSSPNYIDSIRVLSVDNRDDGSGGPFGLASITTNDPLGDPRQQHQIDFESLIAGVASGPLVIDSGSFFSSGDSPTIASDTGYSAQAHFAGDALHEASDSPIMTFTVQDDTWGTFGETGITPVGDSGRGTRVVECSLDAFGNPTDTDDDGICDSWEDTHVIPFTYTYTPIDPGTGRALPAVTVRDGYNLCYGDASTCPDKYRKDVYVEIDYMKYHKPKTEALNKVINAFADAPLDSFDAFTPSGVALHIQLSTSELDHQDSILSWTDADDPTTPQIENNDLQDDFDDIKHAHFGEPSDYGSEAGLSDAAKTARRAALLDAKAQVYHYGLFAHSIGACGPSGLAEVGGNDFIVALGCNFSGLATEAGHDDPDPADGFAYTVGTVNQQAGTLMHELGHNLNLQHGGPRTEGGVDVPNSDYTMNCKPNYQSVMSYTWQTGYYLTQAGQPVIFDYSRQALGVLHEFTLNEGAGIVGNHLERGFVIYATPGLDPRTRSGQIHAPDASLMAIDWDGTAATGTVRANINNFGIVGCNSSPSVDQEFVGHSDWDNLKFKFRRSPDFIDGIHENPIKLPEMTGETLRELEQQALVYDTTNPTGSVLINSGAAFTNSASAELSLECIDNSDLGCAEVRISTDGSLDSEAFEEYAPTKPVTFGVSDGTSSEVTVTVEFKDAAGNPSPVAQDSIMIDRVKPTVSSTQQGKTFTLGQPTVAPDFACHDDVSGVVSCSASVSMLDMTPGTHSYQVTAKDNAGNENTVVITYNVNYKFSGFLELKTDAKKGSAIPLKFKLLDANNVPIKTAIAQLFIDGNPASSTGNSNKGNYFRNAGDQYIFDLDTKGLAAGTHTASVKLNDGTTYTFTLTLK